MFLTCGLGGGTRLLEVSVGRVRVEGVGRLLWVLRRIHYSRFHALTVIAWGVFGFGVGVTG